MKIRSKTAVRFAGTLAAMGTRYLSSTLDYRVAYYDTQIDPAYSSDGGPRIYIFWHEYILFFICLRRHCNLAMLLSRHSPTYSKTLRTGWDLARFVGRLIVEGWRRYAS